MGVASKTWQVQVKSAGSLKVNIQSQKEHGLFRNKMAFAWLLMSVLIVVLDLWTKGLATESLILYRPVELTSWLNMTLAHNYGAAYSLQPVGMCHGGLGTAAKVHLWKTICLPTLLYGTDAVNIDRSDMAQLKSVQGSLIKTALGISKRSHHSHLVCALGICNIMDTVEINTLSQSAINIRKN